MAGICDALTFALQDLSHQQHPTISVAMYFSLPIPNALLTFDKPAVRPVHWAKWSPPFVVEVMRFKEISGSYTTRSYFKT
ncbi:MAG: hypothetical protein IH628_05095 [Proteobacteria bacterium]|nr:hypothetical protein [Pseudomonadota bacterium]